MTLYPAIGRRAATALGVPPRENTSIQCDCCRKVVVAKGKIPPAWLLAGMPRGWERFEGAAAVYHYCAQCKKRKHV